MTTRTPMKQLNLTVRFITPAFMGNAEQEAQWRTPPFKALLRQWWRVAYAAEANFEVADKVNEMRHHEGQLFGHAQLETDSTNGKPVSSRKSLIRMRLEASQSKTGWTKGTQSGVAPLSKGPDTSYAWFGLINRGSGLSDRTAIRTTLAEGERRLFLAYPEAADQQIQPTLQLIQHFGLLGSRSRGGWGALHIEPETPFNGLDIQRYARHLDSCLQDDWAMSLAKDEKGILLWESLAELDTWDKAMKQIAAWRKQVRTNLKKDLRPALGFASPGRMPSPLRWKVMLSKSEKFTIRVFAMPHGIPDSTEKRLSLHNLQSAWRTASRELDGISDLRRFKQGI